MPIDTDAPRGRTLRRAKEEVTDRPSFTTPATPIVYTGVAVLPACLDRFLPHLATASSTVDPVPDGEHRRRYCPFCLLSDVHSAADEPTLVSPWTLFSLGLRLQKPTCPVVNHRKPPSPSLPLSRHGHYTGTAACDPGKPRIRARVRTP